MGCDYRCRCECACFDIEGTITDSAGDEWYPSKDDDKYERIVHVKGDGGQGDFARDDNCACSFVGEARMKKAGTENFDPPEYKKLSLNVLLLGSGVLLARAQFKQMYWEGYGCITLECMPDCMQKIGPNSWREIPDPAGSDTPDENTEPPVLGDPVNVPDKKGVYPKITLYKRDDSFADPIYVVMKNNDCCKQQCVVEQIIIPPDGPIVLDGKCGGCPSYDRQKAWWVRDGYLGAMVCEASDPPEDECDIDSQKYYIHYQSLMPTAFNPGDEFCSSVPLHGIAMTDPEGSLAAWWQVDDINWDTDPVAVCIACASSFGSQVWELTINCNRYYACVSPGVRPGDDDFPAPSVCFAAPCGANSELVEYWDYDSKTRKKLSKLSNICHLLGEDTDIDGDSILVVVKWYEADTYHNEKKPYDYRNGVPVCDSGNSISWHLESAEFVAPPNIAGYSFIEYDCPMCVTQRCNTWMFDHYPYYTYPRFIYEGYPSVQNNGFIIEGDSCKDAVNNALVKKREYFNKSHSYDWAPNCPHHYPKADSCEFGIRNCKQHDPDGSHSNTWYTVELYFCYFCDYSHYPHCDGPFDKNFGHYVSKSYSNCDQAISNLTHVASKWAGQSKDCALFTTSYLCEDGGDIENPKYYWITYEGCGDRFDDDGFKRDMCYCKVIDAAGYSACSNDRDCYQHRSICNNGPCVNGYLMHDYFRSTTDPRYDSTTEKASMWIYTISCGDGGGTLKAYGRYKDPSPCKDPGGCYSDNYPYSLCSGWCDGRGSGNLSGGFHESQLLNKADPCNNDAAEIDSWASDKDWIYAVGSFSYYGNYKTETDNACGGRQCNDPHAGSCSGGTYYALSVPGALICASGNIGVDSPACDSPKSLYVSKCVPHGCYSLYYEICGRDGGVSLFEQIRDNGGDICACYINGDEYGDHAGGCAALSAAQYRRNLACIKDTYLEAYPSARVCVSKINKSPEWQDWEDGSGDIPHCMCRPYHGAGHCGPCQDLYYDEECYDDGCFSVYVYTFKASYFLAFN